MCRSDHSHRNFHYFKESNLHLRPLIGISQFPKITFRIFHFLKEFGHVLATIIISIIRDIPADRSFPQCRPSAIMTP
ncbi:hypothetical protein IAS59_003767 [Cryptococcus gattii]